MVHFPLTAFSSTYVTTSLTFTSRRCVCHFFLRTSEGKTSLLHFLQNECYERFIFCNMEFIIGLDRGLKYVKNTFFRGRNKYLC
jgi:hypothetical protein